MGKPTQTPLEAYWLDARERCDNASRNTQDQFPSHQFRYEVLAPALICSQIRAALSTFYQFLPRTSNSTCDTLCLVHMVAEAVARSVLFFILLSVTVFPPCSPEPCIQCWQAYNTITLLDYEGFVKDEPQDPYAPA